GSPEPSPTQTPTTASLQPSPTPNPDETSTDENDQGDEQESESEPEEPSGPVLMTPEIDAAFAQIARERIARHPFRFYVGVPIKRARTMWFDTHSQYWPFEGALLPLADLDHKHRQHIWLPLFAVLTLVYSVLGLTGGWLLWRSRKFDARRCLL